MGVFAGLNQDKWPRDASSGTVMLALNMPIGDTGLVIWVIWRQGKANAISYVGGALEGAVGEMKFSKVLHVTTLGTMNRRAVDLVPVHYIHTEARFITNESSK